VNIAIQSSPPAACCRTGRSFRFSAKRYTITTFSPSM